MRGRKISSGYEDLIVALVDGDVDFILVGGLAAVVHGSSRFTADVDIVYARDSSNLERMTAALLRFGPRLRDAPESLPFTLDARTLKIGLNFTLQTSAGPIDLLGEIVGGGAYTDLLSSAITSEIFKRPVKVLNLPTLIQVKRAAGRPKDFDAIAELEDLLNED